MGIVTKKVCNECGKERQIKPMIIGGCWQNEYKLTYEDHIGFHIEAVFCSNDCLLRFVSRLIKEKENA